MPNFYDSWRSGGTGRGAYTLEARSATEVPLTLTGASSQSANYFLVQDSASTAILTINSSGNVTIANDLTVSGSTNITIDEAVSGNLTLTGALTVNGNSTLGNASTDTITITGDVTMNNALDVTGIATFSNITSGTVHYLRRRQSAPGLIGSNGALYTLQGDSGTTELFYLDAAGNSVQLTDAGAIAGGSHFDDDENLTFGNTSASPDFTIDWETADADAHYVNFAVSSVSRNIIISEDRNIDWTHAAQTNPTLWIQSADSGTVAQYISIAHNQTDSVITSGTGDIVSNALLQFSTGVAITGTDYQIGRDADGTNQMHFNVPTGATFEFSVNDAVEMTLSASAVNFQNNTITTTGGGSLTGTWSDLGIVTTVDINGGTIDGVTIGGAAAGAITGTTIDATTDFTIGGLVITDGTLTDDAMVLTQTAGTTGATGFTFNIGAHTGITAATQRIGINVPAVTKTWAVGAGPLAAQREIVFLAPTYIGNVAGALTISDAATVYIDAAPTAGADMVLTRSYALWVDAGNVRIDGSLTDGTVTFPLNTIYRSGGTDVALADGGTNASLTASNGGIFYSTDSAGAILAGTATAGQLLLSGATAAPTWSTTTYPATNAISTLLYASSANVMAALATANGGILNTGATGVPSITATPLLGVAGTTAGTLRLSGLTTGVVTIDVAANAGTWAFTLPTGGGAANYAMITDGSGNASWSVLPVAGGGTGVTESTGTGNVVLSSSPALTTPNIGAATGTSVVLTGAITSSSSSGIGYATGAGGAVTQQTNRTTGVSLSTICGQITTNNASLAAESSATFNVGSSPITATDTVIISHTSSNSGNTNVYVSGVMAGSFNITVANNNASGGAAETGAIVINFSIIKAVAA